MDRLWAPWRKKYILRALSGEEECIFCRIPKEDKDEENYLLARGKHAFVVLNIFPYNNGHIMVAPYRHTSDLNELSDEEILDFLKLTGKSQKVLGKVMQPHGFNMGINVGRVAGAGYEEHIHIHIVPRWGGDTNFMPILGETKVISEALDEAYKRLREAW